MKRNAADGLFAKPSSLCSIGTLIRHSILLAPGTQMVILEVSYA